jgi:hypothetical protein
LKSPRRRLNLKTIKEHVPKFSKKFLKIIQVTLHRSKTEKNIWDLGPEELLEREYCGSLIKENDLIYLNGSIARGFNEYNTDRKLKRGACIRKSLGLGPNLLGFHTHYEGLPIYPSVQDIVNVMKRVGTIEYIFTYKGFWILENQGISKDYLIEKNRKQTEKILHDIYYLNHFK